MYKKYTSLSFDVAQSFCTGPFTHVGNTEPSAYTTEEQRANNLHYTLEDYHVSWYSLKLVKLLFSQALTSVHSKRSFVFTRWLAAVTHLHSNDVSLLKIRCVLGHHTEKKACSTAGWSGLYILFLLNYLKVYGAAQYLDLPLYLTGLFRIHWGLFSIAP